MPNRIRHGSNVRYSTRSKLLWITVHPEVCLIEIHTTNNFYLVQKNKNLFNVICVI